MTLSGPATASGPPDRSTLASGRNAARVLRAFSRAGQELGITELSRQLGLSKSTVHRLVTTLTRTAARAGSSSGRYRLGLVLYELRAQHDALEIGARKHLKRQVGANAAGLLFQPALMRIENAHDFLRRLAYRRSVCLSKIDCAARHRGWAERYWTEPQTSRRRVKGDLRFWLRPG